MSAEEPISKVWFQTYDEKMNQNESAMFTCSVHVLTHTHTHFYVDESAHMFDSMTTMYQMKLMRIMCRGMGGLFGKYIDVMSSHFHVFRNREIMSLNRNSKMHSVQLRPTTLRSCSLTRKGRHAHSRRWSWTIEFTSVFSMNGDTPLCRFSSKWKWYWCDFSLICFCSLSHVYDCVVGRVCRIEV